MSNFLKSARKVGPHHHTLARTGESRWCLLFATYLRQIVAIGRNYADHAKELGNAVPTEPFFFLKPTSSFISPGQGPVEIPKGVEMHHEGESELSNSVTLFTRLLVFAGELHHGPLKGTITCRGEADV